MSSIFSTGTIQVDGVATGLQTSTLISELSSVISGSRTLMQNEVAELTTLSTNYTTLNSRLDTLNSTLTAIDTTAEFREFSVSSPTGASYTMTADGDAAPGAYTVAVMDLAEAQVDRFQFGSTTSFSDDTAALGFDSETVSIDVNGTTTTFSVSTTTTLSNLATNLNAITGISAYVVQTSSSTSSAANAYELIIQADDTGKDGGAQRVLNFSSSSTSISLDNIQEADNAEIRVGGSGGSTIESASNTITAIDGVTIVANSADSTDYVSTVSLDTSAMATKVEAMVSAFNGVVSFISTNSSITSSGTNQSSVALGSFVGESTPRMILQMMRSTLSDDYASFIGDRATHRTSLSQMGISTQSSGLLQFSSSEFIETLNDYQSDVENMFSSTSGSFSDAMQDVLDAFIDPVLGIIDSQTDRIAEEIDDYNTAIEFENTRITRYEARLQSQFNNLETLTSSFTTTSSFLTSFFANNS